MIYTASYDHLYLARERARVISIERKPPEDFNLPQFKPFIPSERLMFDYEAAGCITYGQFADEYLDQLRNLPNLNEIVRRMRRYDGADNDDLIFVGYERQRSYRHLLAQFFNIFDIQEL